MILLKIRCSQCTFLYVVMFVVRIQVELQHSIEPSMKQEGETADAHPFTDVQPSSTKDIKKFHCLETQKSCQYVNNQSQ